VGPGRHLDLDPHALAISAVTSVVLMVFAQRLVVDRGTEEDLTPSRVIKVPEMQEPPRAGRGPGPRRVLHRSRPGRRIPGADGREPAQPPAPGCADWQLLHDLYEPAHYVEQIIDASWTEHLRRFDRISGADVALRDRRLSFHVGEEPPRVTRYLIEQE
jgi:hypothetical protein